jgi:outer membrane protein assembly factor BamB
LPFVEVHSEGIPEVRVGVLDTRRGQLKWERTIPRKASRIANLSAYGTGVQVGIEEEAADAGVTLGFDLMSGELRFEHAGTISTYLLVDRRRSVVLRHSQGLTCLDSETGKILWSWTGKTGGPSPNLGERRILVYLESGLAVLDSASGAELWRRPVASDEELLNSPDRLWVLRGCQLTELDPDSGEDGPSFGLPQPSRGGSATARFVYVLLPRGLQALGAETLQPVWTWESPSETSRLFATSEGIVVETNGGRTKNLVDPETGRQIASLEVPDINGSGYSFTRGRLFTHFSYRTSQPPKYTIIDARAGPVLWEGEASDCVEAGTSKAVYAWNGNDLRRLDLERRDIVWIKTLPEAISEVMTYSGKLLLVAGHHVVALGPSTGTELWRFELSPSLESACLGYWRPR